MLPRIGLEWRIPSDRCRILLMVGKEYKYIEENKEGFDSLKQSKKTPRLPICEVFFNTFGQPWIDPLLSTNIENTDYDPATMSVSDAVGIRQDLSLVVLPSAKQVRFRRRHKG